MTTRTRTPTRRCDLAGWRRALALIVAVLGLVLATAPTALAQDGGDEAPITWGVRPSTPEGPDGRDTFEYSLDPGATIEDYVGVSNFTDQPLELAVYASDAFTTAEGGFDLLPAADEPVDVGAWVEFGAVTVTVPARSRLEVPFRLTIPTNATPGEHAGGIVASLAAPGTDTDGGQVTVDRRVGARIYLRVNGELDPSVTVGDVDLRYDTTLNPASRGDATVTYTINNTGNVRIAGTPTVEVAGPFGLGRVTTRGEPIAELLPGDSLTLTTDLDAVAPLGRLTATVTLTPESIGGPDAGALPAVTTSATSWAIPWTQLAIVIVIVLTAIRRRRRRRRRRRDLDAKLAAARAEGRDEALITANGVSVTGHTNDVVPSLDTESDTTPP